MIYGEYVDQVQEYKASKETKESSPQHLTRVGSKICKWSSAIIMHLETNSSRDSAKSKHLLDAKGNISVKKLISLSSHIVVEHWRNLRQCKYLIVVTIFHKMWHNISRRAEHLVWYLPSFPLFFTNLYPYSCPFVGSSFLANRLACQRRPQHRNNTGAIGRPVPASFL